VCETWRNRERGRSCSGARQSVYELLLSSHPPPQRRRAIQPASHFLFILADYAGCGVFYGLRRSFHSGNRCPTFPLSDISSHFQLFASRGLLFSPDCLFHETAACHARQVVRPGAQLVAAMCALLLVSRAIS